MTQAKIEPGEGSISLGKDKDKRAEKQKETEEEKDLLPELGLKRPAKPKDSNPKASPLDPGIDLGD